MPSINKDLLYVAYKEMLMKNIDHGLFAQHSGEATHLYFREDRKLFFICLEESVKRYNGSRFLESFFEFNPDLKKDMGFMKEVLLRLNESCNYWVQNNKIPINYFDGDTEFMAKLIKNTGSTLMNAYEDKLPKTRVDEKLREILYKDETFRFAYFDLPYEKSPEILKRCLQQDPLGYTLLDDEDLKNKELLMIALSPSIINSIKYIYEKMPDDLKYDKDVIGRLIHLNFYKQDKNVFLENPEIFEKIMLKEKAFDNFKEIGSKIDLEIFSDNRCLLSFFTAMVNVKGDLSVNTTTLTRYKSLISGLRKINPYLKGRINVGELKNSGTKESLVDEPELIRIELGAIVLNEKLLERNQVAGIDNNIKKSKTRI